MVFHFSHAENL
jgi:hypothetical protein